MARTVAIGVQDFEKYITKNYFYVDKTKFIKEWWQSGDDTTVVMRPRRFGKTLTMDMVKTFFSLEYKEKGEKIFGGLEIWQDEEMRALQGTYPVIFLTFADIKSSTYKAFMENIKWKLSGVCDKYGFLLRSDLVDDNLKAKLKNITYDMSDSIAPKAINILCEAMSAYYGKKVLIILDEYDTPMQEAYVSGYWNDAVEFLRNFFNSTFKTNPYLERSLMTGITRISKESIFSDFNHVKLVTMMSDEYADCFGFTEDEVFVAMDECELVNKEDVKTWYNGFVVGCRTRVYNPWSIINFLDTNGKFYPYWANTSENSLVNTLLKTSDIAVKQLMEKLIAGESIRVVIDDEIVFNRLNSMPMTILSLLYASGYLTGTRVEPVDIKKLEYNLHITNLETTIMFQNMIDGWFKNETQHYNDFIKAMLMDDVDYMEEFMNDVALATFSSFDTGKKPSEKAEPEKFYHGFVLGMMVDLRDRFVITSNKESGFGRYDIMLEPKNDKDNAIIIEFKVFKPRREKDLAETVANALKQIDDMKYETVFLEKGIPAERIKKYGFAFEGKNVLIGC